MQRVTVTLDEALLTELDRLVETRGYQGRSEAVRDLVRAGLRDLSDDGAAAGRDCVAALVYVYDHEARSLSRRLTRAFHDHHDLALASMHVHLDHDSCMEVAVLQGSTADVRHLADHVMAERGVRHGRLVAIPVALADEKHPHGTGNHRHPHAHVREAG